MHLSCDCSQGVRQIIFTIAWMNQLPLLDTIQFQRAFSLGANVTLLAANIRNDRLIMTGSGIYTPSSATYHHAQRGDPEEGRLLVARVPVLDPELLGQEQTPAVVETPGFCYSENCAESGPSLPPSSSAVFISSMMYDPFTFALLNWTDGEVTVCNGTFCCYLQYQWLRETGGTELYALGAFAGTHTVNGRYAVQVRTSPTAAGVSLRPCDAARLRLSAGVRSGPLRRPGSVLLRTGGGRGRVQTGLCVRGEVWEQVRVSVGAVQRDGAGAAGADGGGRRRQSQPETLQPDGWADHRLPVRPHVSPGRCMSGKITVLS